MAFQSNLEFLTELMQFSPKGPLVQVFIIHAVHAAARQVAAAPDPSVFDSAALDGRAWQDVAKHIAERMDEKYGSFDRDAPAPD